MKKLVLLLTVLLVMGMVATAYAQPTVFGYYRLRLVSKHDKDPVTTGNQPEYDTRLRLGVKGSIAEDVSYMARLINTSTWSAGASEGVKRPTYIEYSYITWKDVGKIGFVTLTIGRQPLFTDPGFYDADMAVNLLDDEYDAIKFDIIKVPAPFGLWAAVIPGYRRAPIEEGPTLSDMRFIARGSATLPWQDIKVALSLDSGVKDLATVSFGEASALWADHRYGDKALGYQLDVYAPVLKDKLDVYGAMGTYAGTYIGATTAANYRGQADFYGIGVYPKLLEKIAPWNLTVKGEYGLVDSGPKAVSSFSGVIQRAFAQKLIWRIFEFCYYGASDEGGRVNLKNAKDPDWVASYFYIDF